MTQVSRPTPPSWPRGLGLEVIPVSASFTWDATYNDRVIRSDAGSGITITLPSDAVGGRSIIHQFGAGAVTIAADANGALHSANGVSATATQYDTIEIVCIKAGVWTVRGLGTFNGVIGGTTPAAGTFTSTTTTGIDTVSVANALTASTTQTRVGGTALTKRLNRITTCANAGDAVTLPALSPGQSVDVYNDGAAAASVFPNGASDTIDGGAGGAAVTLTNAKRCRYTCFAANTIISAQLGVVSA